jgi:hypothetical protein
LGAKILQSTTTSDVIPILDKEEMPPVGQFRRFGQYPDLEDIAPGAL